MQCHDVHWRARRHEPLRVDEPVEWPTVSIAIAAPNEATCLPVKLKALEEFDYPAGKIEWIILSDGSTEGTQDFLQEAFAAHNNRHVEHLPTSPGKCGALNAMLAFQIAFYAVAAASYLDLPGSHKKLVNMMKDFLQLNAAAVVATFRYFGSSRSISWR